MGNEDIFINTEEMNMKNKKFNQYFYHKLPVTMLDA